jgi:hypothetical protein
MITQFISDKKFVVVLNGEEVIFNGYLENQEITTGQPKIELFNNLDEAILKYGDKIIMEVEDEFYISDSNDLE